MELEAPPIQTPSNSWQADQPIVVDFGSYQAKFGMASASAPAHSFVAASARARDKKGAAPSKAVVGAKALDATAKNAIRLAHEQGTVVNWDVVENTLDYGLELLGVHSEGSVQSPLVISEQMGAPLYTRRYMQELLFENYGVPQVATAVDVFAAFPRLSSGIGVHLGHEAVHVTPFNNGQPSTQHIRRLNWGGRRAADLLQNLMVLKYPYFPINLRIEDAAQIFRRSCYVSQNYSEELRKFMDLEYLASHERIVQLPILHSEPTASQLAAQADQRRVARERLMAKVAADRRKKLENLQKQLASLEQIQSEGAWEDHFDSEEMLESEILKVKRAIDPSQVPEEEPPETPLLEMPDGQLTGEQLKEKRRQKLMRANYDARMKQKAEKARAAQQQAEAEAKEAKWRQQDLKGWIKAKREQLFTLNKAIKERAKLRAQLSDRRSAASKMRMKEIVLLASGDANKKRKLKDAPDDFGANDSDWAIYHVEEHDEEADKDELARLSQQLLEHDESFSMDELREKHDWRASVMHKFLFGAHPYSSSNSAQRYQLNLNVERIRVPEVLFNPAINGVDQAGIAEICQGLLGGSRDIYLSGGLANLPGLGSRLEAELRQNLPVGTPLKVHTLDDPSNAAWRGMAAWAPNASYLTRQQYDEGEVERHEFRNIW